MVSQETKQEVFQKVENGLKGLTRLSNFSSYAVGTSFTAADISAWLHLRLVGRATEAVYGENLVTKHIPNIETYLQNLETRQSIKHVAADQEVALAAFQKR